jgi:aconitate hydratase
MMRGTFANIRLRNQLAPGTEGGVTLYLGEGDDAGKQLSIYGAAMRYIEAGTPLIVLAGKEYGSGSSRDWAAKGTRLLGVRAVIAESFERIHRSNLIGMGIAPLQFLPGESLATWDLDGSETYDVIGLEALNGGEVPKTVTVRVRADDGTAMAFEARLRIDAAMEADYMRHGGVLNYVLRSLATEAR